MALPVGGGTPWMGPNGPSNQLQSPTKRITKQQQTNKTYKEMKAKNKPTTLNIVLCVVTLLAIIVADVLTIVALTTAPLWKTSIVEAIFWSLVMLGVVVFLNVFTWAMWKEVFNK